MRSPAAPRHLPAASIRGLMLALPAAVLGLAGCQPQHAAPPPPATPTVGVIEVAEREVNPYHEFVGKTQASESVSLRARQTGFLEERNFDEGDDILAGHILFRIEAAPSRAVVAQAEAELAAAEASVNQAQVDLRRYEQLAKKQGISETQVDEARADALVKAAAVKQAQAALERARLDLGYTEIRAPISGRIDVAALDVGNLVSPESGVLATINKLDPIEVGFSISETRYLELMQRRLARQRANEDKDADRHVPLVRLPDGTRYEHAGRFDFIDNKVDDKTGTVFIRAEFPNPDKLLLPGQFVTVVVEREAARRAVLVPQSTVLTDQGGHYVLVINAESKVEVRRIETGQRYGADWLVEAGLESGDRVIFSGIQKVRPGIVVDTKAVAAPQAPSVTGLADQG